MSRAIDWRRATFVSGMLVLTLTVFYANFAARDIMFGDGGELSLAAATNGVAHPPGYPLWIVLGHLFSLLPIGSVPFRINVSAVIYQAITVGLVFLSAYVLTRRYVASVTAALLLATNELFVTWSLQAEVFSLNDVFAAALVLLSLLVLDDGKRWRLVVPIAALFGLGLANQQTLVLLAPLAAWAFVCRRDAIPREPASAVFVVSGVVLVLGFCLPYIHTWLASQRELGWSFGQARTLHELLDVILRRAYGTATLVNGPIAGGSMIVRVYTMLTGVGVVVLLASAEFVVLVHRRRYDLAGAVALIFFGTVVVFCAMANNDASIAAVRDLFLRFALLPLVALAPFAAPVLALRRVPAIAVLSVVLVFGAHSALGASLATVADARTLDRDEFAALPRGAVAFVKGDSIATTAPYFQIVEGWRPDVLLVFVDLLPGRSYVEQLRRSLIVPKTSGPPTLTDIVAANPNRHFFGIGDPEVQGEINGDGGPFVAYTCGLASEIVTRRTFIPLSNWYRTEVFRLRAPKYGELSGRTIPFAAVARAYYANSYFNAGIDAERLRGYDSARTWFALALTEVPDSPTIIQAFVHLNELSSA